ncbi:hypothetical protein RD792_015520 [Penstemon davidsonii]|uniref:Protein OBERON 4 n=1 Tax=Penstemon davidsonii TaxID=160366 RepID=A0ABR0CH12_9LAMI|nr:hypothetical protein RD792_015520 [Penstemon davidsonii]
MKKLRSSDDIESYGEKGIMKDWVRKDDDTSLQRSSSSLHRNSYYKSSDSGRKVLSSSASRYDRLEDDRESSRMVRKRSDYDVESYDRRKTYDRNREGNERGISSSSPRGGYGMERMHRSESFSGPRRDFPKGFRSERDRSRREGSVTSWRRFGGTKDGDDGARSGSEVSRANRMELDDVGKANKSPQAFRDAKSPAWSKDSGSEQSKSVEVKKYEDMPVESGGGPSSEREEGELEPDPQPPVPSTEPVVKDKAPVKLDLSQKEHSRANFLSVEEGDSSKKGSYEEQGEGGLPKIVQDDLNKNKDLQNFQDTGVQDMGRCGDENETTGETEGENNILEGKKEAHFEENAEGKFDDNLSYLQEQEGDKGTDLEMKAEDINTSREVGIKDRINIPLMEETTQSWKDKGKGVAALPSNSVHFGESNLDDEDKPRELPTSGDIEMEGPSTLGFQFFSSDPIKKQDKFEQSTHNNPKYDKLALDLSLSLPNVLLPIDSQNRGQAPGSPSHARSVQSFPSSFRTNSDGFTASMSFSGSQQFTHNPSCSLTHNTYDFEQSVGSKPLFQGVDWKALSLDENKNKEVPALQGMPSRCNGFPHQSQGNSIAMAQHLRVTGESSKLPIGFEKQLSFNRHYENGPESSKDSRHLTKEKDNGGIKRSNDPDGNKQLLVVEADFAESIITMLVSEPLHTMAHRFNNMAAQHTTCVKEFVLDIISNPSKQWQLSTLQKALRKRSDFTLDMLKKAHRTQLEILVALRTGFREFLLPKYELPSTDLAETFLNMRCRNLTCRSFLPLDECDCKICAQKNGFCRECMCLVCSKFDNASNTCSWVGCDVCMHWCHADCGLRESHIRNGRSAKGDPGTTEMQFHCVACGHPSEMFGFVKEVFQNFVKEWTAENLCRELEYVRKLFSTSKDGRGKELLEIATRVLTKLGNKADLQEVQNQIMSFFAETESLKPGKFSIESTKEMPAKDQERSYNGFAGSSQGAGWLKPSYPDKPTPLENSVNIFPRLDNMRNDKYTTDMDLRKITKEPIFDELESIVRIKQAEAKMFQARADDARKEAEALRHISVTKNERVEEEYSSRITKLRLAEAEEMRKQKLEELQALEISHQEYFIMKMRMETDIKDLLLKMEATRRNLPR